MAVSTLTFSDEVTIRSSLHALADNRYLCTACTSHRNHEKIKKLYRCEDRAPEPVHTVMQEDVVLKYDRCVGNYFNHQVVQWVEVANQADKGLLPFAGGYLEQPNKAIEIIRMIKGEQYRQAKAKEKESLRRMKKHGR